VVEEANGHPEEKRRGPRGGIHHTPGRDHDQKSAKSRKKRFAKQRIKRRKEREEKAREAWEKWDSLSEDARRLLGDKGKPKLPRPKNE
jgi:hypothetical protein